MIISGLRILLLMCYFWGFAVNAQEFSTEQTIESLRSNQIINFTLLPTVHAYRELCRDRNSGNEKLLNNLGEICSTVLGSGICKDVPADKRLECKNIESHPQLDLWDFLQGCAKGVFASVENFLGFIWDVMKWVWNNTTDSETRSATIEQATEYINIVKLYLHTEFEKAYAQQDPPLRTVKALKAMGGSIANLILSNITDLMNQKYQQLACLNFEAKSQLICQFVGEIFIPPAAALSLIKYGPEAIKKFPNLSRAFAKLDALQPPVTPSARSAQRVEEAQRVAQ